MMCIVRLFRNCGCCEGFIDYIVVENAFAYFYWKKAIGVNTIEGFEIVKVVIMSTLRGVSEYLSKSF